MVEHTVELINRLGLHARAAAKLVHVSSRFSCEILVRHDDEEVNGKSILGLLLLAAPCGAELNLKAIGIDEQEAIEALVDLIEGRFGEAE